MIISTLLLIKILVTIILVLGLSLIAEYINPKVSGILSGIPTGTAIILFFYGLEQGPNFASQSSVFNLVGMLGLQVFILIYFLSSKSNSKGNIFISSLLATLGYLITIFLLNQFNFSLLTAIIFPLISIPLFTYLFKKINNSTIKKIKVNPKVLFLRAIFSSIFILLIIGLAKILGPEWAGLLSAFPTTVFPLILIMHFSYGKEPVHTIIKNIPKGQWAMLVYIPCIFFLYPLLGIYLGTLIAYSLVMLYLLIVFKFSK